MISLNSKGFTITELLLAALFGLIVMAALYGFFRDQLFFLVSQETQTATREDARGALNLMARELRNAGAWGTGTAPAGCSRIVTATATVIQVQADLNADGDCDGATNPDETGENVTYAFVSTPNPSGDPCPGASITRNGDCLAANVIIPSGNFFSTYYIAGSTTPLSFPISDLTTIKRVKITFAIEETNPNPKVGGKISSTLSSSVIFRN